MGFKRFLCCTGPAVALPNNDRTDLSSRHQPGAFRDTSGPKASSADPLGGRSLLVNASSGTAQDFLSHLRHSPPAPRSPSVPAPADCAYAPAPDQGGLQKPQHTGAHFSAISKTPERIEALASRAHSCPVGDLQQPPRSLAEASIRRRSRARTSVTVAKGPCSLVGDQDAQQLATIQAFMSAYLCNLESTSSDLMKDVAPLLASSIMLQAHDGKIYHGQSATLRRLQHGTCIIACTF